MRPFYEPEVKTVTMRASVAIVALLTAGLGGCSRAPELQKFGQVPEFELVSQTGQKVTLASLKGHVWIADTIFTQCQGPCPMMTSKMRRVAAEVAAVPAIRIVSVTVDPAHDTPEALLGYSKSFHANPEQWLFLTGAPEVLNRVSLDGLHISKVDGSLEHGTRFALVDQNAEVRGYYQPFNEEQLKQLVADAKYLAAR